MNWNPSRNLCVAALTLTTVTGFAVAAWLNRGHLDVRPVEAAAAVAEDASPVAAMVGKPAPDFALEDLNGKKVVLHDLAGKAVLVNFWATWCGPCRIETPWLVALHKKYAAEGFEILGISADDLTPSDPAMLAEQKRKIGRAAHQLGIDYPVLIDGGSLSKPYGGLDSLPASFFVDRKGNVVAAVMGITAEDEIEANIRKALGH